MALPLLSLIPGVLKTLAKVVGGDVFEKVHQLVPSARGELEITDLHNRYLREHQLTVSIVQGRWIDAGTFDALLEANLFMAEKAKARERVAAKEAR